MQSHPFSLSLHASLAAGLKMLSLDNFICTTFAVFIISFNIHAMKKALSKRVTSPISGAQAFVTWRANGAVKSVVKSLKLV